MEICLVTDGMFTMATIGSFNVIGQIDCIHLSITDLNRIMRNGIWHFIKNLLQLLSKVLFWHANLT